MPFKQRELHTHIALVLPSCMHYLFSVYAADLHACVSVNAYATDLHACICLVFLQQICMHACMHAWIDRCMHICCVCAAGVEYAAGARYV